MFLNNKKVVIVLETDSSCGGYGTGSIDRDLFISIEEEVSRLVSRLVDPLFKDDSKRVNSVRDALISSIHNVTLYEELYKILGIYNYNVLSKEDMPFSEAIGAYKALQSVKGKEYLPDDIGYGNCDAFEEITYKDDGEIKKVYHHYIQGDGGSIFFILK